MWSITIPADTWHQSNPYRDWKDQGMHLPNVFVLKGTVPMDDHWYTSWIKRSVPYDGDAVCGT